MTMSRHRYTSNITGLLDGGAQKVSDAEFSRLQYCWSGQAFEQITELPVKWDALTLQWRHLNESIYTDLRRFHEMQISTASHISPKIIRHVNV